MAATGPHTYTCDGCFQDLDENGIVILRDQETSATLHFHGYDHVASWADRRHAEHTALVAKACIAEEQRLIVEAWCAFHPNAAQAAAQAPDPVAALEMAMKVGSE